MGPVRLTYAFDAYCGWCYGFGPALSKFCERHEAEITVNVISGGLFSGERLRPIRAFAHIGATNARIAELTGVVFGAEYEALVDKGEFVMNSEDAAVGLAALRAQAPDRPVAAARAMQQAFYLHGCSLSEPDTYRFVATELGLEPEAVLSSLASAESRQRAAADQAATRELGIAAYPSLLVQVGTRHELVGDATSTADELSAAVEHALAT